MTMIAIAIVTQEDAVSAISGPAIAISGPAFAISGMEASAVPSGTAVVRAHMQS